MDTLPAVLLLLVFVLSVAVIILFLKLKKIENLTQNQVENYVQNPVIENENVNFHNKELTEDSEEIVMESAPTAVIEDFSQQADRINQSKTIVISTVLANKTLSALETMTVLQAEILAHLQNTSRDAVMNKYTETYQRKQVTNALNLDFLADYSNNQEDYSDNQNDSQSSIDEGDSDGLIDNIFDKRNISILSEEDLLQISKA